MFRSRKSSSSSSPQISPLEPPRTMQANGNLSPSYAAGNPMDRVGSYTSDSMKSDKTAKRRSGFFGLGKKDKEREKEDEGSSQPRPTSFSVERNRTSSPHPGGAPQSPSDFQPHAMHRYPNPKGHTPPPPDNLDPPQAQNSQPMRQEPQQRIVSTPANGNGGPSDFGPPNSLPKSQSMGFSRPNPVPDTHPYRGYLKAQQEKQMQAEAQQQGTLPKSQSMPLNDTNGHPGASPPVREIENPRSMGAGPPQGQAGWTKEFDAVVDLIGAQPQKTYVASPPELEMILARTSAGGQPKQGQPGSASNDWDGVWLQLSGISLSMWSMKETRAAASRGDKVPPTYFNITDSSLELLAPLPPPPHRPTSHPHHFVFSLNTAGSTRLLFSCPSERDLARWATGLRIAAWERARLEEIYTGHIIKSGPREPKSELVRGRMEGWVRVRVMGGTDWKRLWVVLSQPGTDEQSKEDEKKGRRKSFFGKPDKLPEPIQEPNTGVSMASFYLEPRTPKNKTSPAALTITNITQAYAVFPERLEVMSQSNLMKVVGKIGGELVTIEGRLRDSGWALIMPESPSEGSASPPPSSPLANMMRWVTGFHDVFGLYGRPRSYIWDPSDPKSLFFAYPRGEDRGQLFLDIDDAIVSDFRTSNLAVIRSQFIAILQRKLQRPAQEYRAEEEDQPTPRLEGSYRLPPLPFGETSAHSSDHSAPRSLTPITERTDITDTASRTNSQRTAKSNFLVNERQHSGSGNSLKQSGGSMKHPANYAAGQEERLAPIADSNEANGQIFEEPMEQPTEEKAMSPTSPEPTPTTIESSNTLPTTWSQSTADTPTQSFSETISPTDAPVHAGPHQIPAPMRSSPLPSKQDLGEPPSSTSSKGPVLGGIISSPVRAAPPVLSPTPHRPTIGDLSPTGSPLQDEPAAMYLMNMVERSPPSQSQQHQSKSPEQRPNPAPERSRPKVITSLDSSPPLRQTSESLGRKPSGARALPQKKLSGPRNTEAVGNEKQLEREDDRRDLPSASTQPDLGEDVSAYVAYAEMPSPAKQMPRPKASPPPPVQQDDLRSSFALSKTAAERRAKAEQAAADQQRAKSIPGGGKRMPGADTWSGSDDDEEEEESPVVATRPQLPQPPQPRSYSPPQQVHRVVSQPRALPAIPIPTSRQPEIRMSNGESDDHRQSLPQVPVEQPRSRSPAPPQQAQPQQAAPNRQTLWNANFSADHGMAENKSGKFVEVGEPSAQLTKAFAPHGLLQAGIQDKEDRSAKKQEEVAREMGSSLINVPNKPPPPQTGLLGAVAAHERDRKNAGGIGATLTDRERERRQGEDRQREMEKMQRQQMDQMSQYGGNNMYGGQFPYGMPMMGMQGMQGMQGMPMGYNPYQGQYNPYAQQQAMMAAQMAYQQAMMSMSQQGGSPDRSSSPAGSVGGYRRSSPPPMPGYLSPGLFAHPSPGIQMGGGGGGGQPSPSPYFGVQPNSNPHNPHMSLPMPPFGWPGMGALPWGSPSPPPTGSPSWMQPRGQETPYEDARSRHSIASEHREEGGQNRAS